MPLSVRPYRATKAELSAVVHVRNANWPDSPVTVSQQQQTDAERDPSHFFSRLVGELDGRIIIVGECGATAWLEEPDQFFWHYNIQPESAGQGHEEAMHAALMARLARQNPRRFYVGMRDDKTDQRRFIEERGYQQVEVEQTSALDTSCFAADDFSAVIAATTAGDIKISDLGKLQSTDPHWAPKLWALQWSVRRDIPRAGQAIREPFARFYARVTDPTRHNPALHFVAVGPGETDIIGPYIGMTRLSIDSVNPTVAHTNLTGIVDGYRRRGLATALKVHAINAARALGVRRIETMNHADNPMCTLNRRLGFVPGPAWRYYVLDVGELEHTLSEA